MALAGERSEPVRLGLRDHHACSVQATSRVQSDAGDGIIFLARCRVRIRPAGQIEPPRRHAVRPSVPATPAEIPVAAAYPPPSSSNANSLCCAVSATSPELPAATRADFDPNGFRSSSPTTPATQSVITEIRCRKRPAYPGQRTRQFSVRRERHRGFVASACNVGTLDCACLAYSRAVRVKKKGLP